MLTLVLAALAIAPNSYFSFAFVHFVVPMNHRRLYALGSTGITILYWLLINTMFESPPVLASYLTLLFGSSSVLYFAPKGRRIQALITHLTLMAIQLVCNIVVLLLPIVFPAIPPCLSSRDPVYPLYCLACTVLCFPTMLGLVKVSRRILPPLEENRALLALMLIPEGQILMLVFCLKLFYYGNTGGNIGADLLLTALIFVAEYAAILYGYRGIRKVNLLHLRTIHAEEQLQVQVNYYRELQSGILEINQVRHDLSNQLQAAYCMMEKGDTAHVRGQLDQIQTQLQDRVGTTYCPNMVADAVLTSKARQCRSHGIPLEVSVFLPSDLSIETAHLCSIFSNLLDNSIAGTLRTAAPYEPIELYADLHGAYLTIRCVNPSLEPTRSEKKDPLRSHGLGLQILSQLAQVYHGSFKTTYRDGSFTAVMHLQVPQS